MDEDWDRDHHSFYDKRKKADFFFFYLYDSVESKCFVSSQYFMEAKVHISSLRGV